MSARVKLLVLMLGSLAGCASSYHSSVTSADQPNSLLSFYAKAYAAGAYGFSCVPAAYKGGPADPRIAEQRQRLAQQQQQIRERLVAKFGAAQIDSIEQNHFREVESAYWAAPCSLANAKQERDKYRRLLDKLEQQIKRSD